MLFPNTEKTLPKESVQDDKNHTIESIIGIDIIDHLEKILEIGTKNYKDQITLNKLQFLTPAYYPDFVLLDKIKPDAYLRRKTTKGISPWITVCIRCIYPQISSQIHLKTYF